MLEIVGSKGVISSCRCTVCGAEPNNGIVSMTYKTESVKSGKATCNYCKLLRKHEAVRNKNKEIWFEGLRKDAEYTSFGWSGRVSSGDIIGLSKDEDIQEIVEFRNYIIGNTYGDGIFRGVLVRCSTLPTGYMGFIQSTAHGVFRCKYCDSLGFVNASVSKYSCYCCGDARAKLEKKKQDSKHQKMLKRAETLKEKALPHMTGGISQALKNSNLAKRIDTFNANNKGFKCVDIEVGKNTYYFTAVCLKCGDTYKVNRTESKIGECTFCKERNVNEQGWLFRDYTHVVINGLEVKSQNNESLVCNIECIYCKRKETIPLYDFLKGRYYCNCDGLNKQFQDVECSNCYTLLPDIKALDFFKGGALKCKCCGTDNRDMYEIYSKAADSRASMVRRVKFAQKQMSGSSIKLSTRLVGNNLICEKEPLYKGNKDGLKYYRCYCNEHSKFLVLNEQEVEKYGGSLDGHKHCYDSRQRIIGYPDARDIKLQ